MQFYRPLHWTQYCMAYAYAMLIGMVMFWFSDVDKGKIWWGAVWSATFLTIIIPSLAMLMMIEEILQHRKPRPK